jgi:plasmid stability protein
MPAITVRDVPEATRRELAARAARAGQSLQEYLKAVLVELADRPDPEAVIDRIRQDKARFGIDLDVETMLRWRDDDRR